MDQLFLYNFSTVKDLFLSVVIPSYDEMANLQKGVLEKVKSFLDKKKITYEVIVVDDGSKDGSIEFVKKFAKENTSFHLIENKHTGKAGAVTTGMLAAKGTYVLFTDMDQATPIEEVDHLLPFFEKGYDVVIGSRNTTRKGSPFIRLFISRSNIILRKIIVGMPEITDTQCGFKIFRHESAQKVFGKLRELHNGFAHIKGSNVASGFDVEALYITEKMGYKIREVPVEWLYVETRRVNPLNDSIEGVKALLQIRLNQLSGRY